MLSVVNYEFIPRPSSRNWVHFSFLLSILCCCFFSLLASCAGHMYKGYCLQAAVGRRGQSPVPAGCTVKTTPSLSWTYSDYLAICHMFATSTTTCSNIDQDRNGGRCSNYPALLAFENNGNPDVWVSASRFSWRPTYSFTTLPDCVLLSGTGTVVYMCEKTTTFCQGWLYKGICLVSEQTSTTTPPSPPSSCQVYQPTASWTFFDFVAICNHVTGSRCTRYVLNKEDISNSMHQ